MTREEIAERLRANATGDLHRELADAVRALPVLATCGECGWCDRDDEGAVCGKAEAVGDRIADTRAAPPGWCPLRGGR